MSNSTTTTPASIDIAAIWAAAEAAHPVKAGKRFQLAVAEAEAKGMASEVAKALIRQHEKSLTPTKAARDFEGHRDYVTKVRDVWDKGTNSAVKKRTSSAIADHVNAAEEMAGAKRWLAAEAAKAGTVCRRADEGARDGFREGESAAVFAQRWTRIARSESVKACLAKHGFDSIKPTGLVADYLSIQAIHAVTAEAEVLHREAKREAGRARKAAAEAEAAEREAFAAVTNAEAAEAEAAKAAKAAEAAAEAAVLEAEAKAAEAEAAKAKATKAKAKATKAKATKTAEAAEAEATKAKAAADKAIMSAADASSACRYCEAEAAAAKAAAKVATAEAELAEAAKAEAEAAEERAELAFREAELAASEAGPMFD